MRFFSQAINYPSIKVILGVLMVAMIWANATTRKTVIQALFAVAIANTFTEAFKHLWPMARPFQELKNPDVIMWVGTAPSHGTASAHAANMAAVAFVFVYFLRWWGSPWVAIALLVGVSRVYCGAHYPYQVVLGWICGILSALLVTKGWDLYQSRRARDQVKP